METEMTYRQYRRSLTKKGVYVSMYQGSYGSNFDGTWWTAMWSDSGSDQINTTAHKRDHGLAYSRQKATEKAYQNRAKREGIVLTDWQW